MPTMLLVDMVDVVLPERDPPDLTFHADQLEIGVLGEDAGEDERAERQRHVELAGDEAVDERAATLRDGADVRRPAHVEVRRPSELHDRAPQWRPLLGGPVAARRLVREHRAPQATRRRGARFGDGAVGVVARDVGHPDQAVGRVRAEVGEPVVVRAVARPGRVPGRGSEAARPRRRRREPRHPRRRCPGPPRAGRAPTRRRGPRRSGARSWCIPRGDGRRPPPAPSSGAAVPRRPRSRPRRSARPSAPDRGTPRGGTHPTCPRVG